MFSQKSRAYDYRDPSILTLPKYNTITHGKKCFIYEGAKLLNSIRPSNGIKTIENISEFNINFQNLKRYLKSGMDLLAYVKIASFAP